MRRQCVAAAAMVGIFGLGVMACSSDGSEERAVSGAPAESSVPATPEPTSDVAAREQYVARGNAICEEMQVAVDEIESGFGPDGPATLGDLGSGFDSTADVVDETLSALRELPSPEGDEEILDAMHDGVEEYTVLMRELAAAAQMGDRSEMDQLAAQLDELTVRVNQKYADYGLTVCAE